MRLKKSFICLSICSLTIASAVAKPTCNLLVVGDSLSAGYGLAADKGWVNLLQARLSLQLSQWKVINVSVSGDTTQNGLQRLPAALKRYAPKAVLIELGANDALRGMPPSFTKQNLQTMVQNAKASGAWVGVFEIPVLPNYGKAYASAINHAYTGVIQQEKVAKLPCFVCQLATQTDLMQADRLHPNERAQPKVLDIVWPYLVPHLQNKCRAL